VDSAGNLFIASSDQHSVFKVDASGQLTVVAGNGTEGSDGDGNPATSARLSHPSGVAVDTVGNLFIADTSNSRIRRVDARTGSITTVAGLPRAGFAGDGDLATSARLNQPTGVAVDKTGNLFIADRNNHRVRRVDARTGIVTTVAGNGTEGFGGDGGPATSARLNQPTRVAVDRAGNLFIADVNNRCVRRVDAATGIIATLDPSFRSPGGVAVDRAGNLLVADPMNFQVRRLNPRTGTVTTVANLGAELGRPVGLAVDAAGNLFVSTWRLVLKVDPSGKLSIVAGDRKGGIEDDGPATKARLEFPSDVAVDRAGNLFIADSSKVRRVDAATGIITTFVGEGTCGFGGDGGGPRALAVDRAGNLFIASTRTIICRVDAATGTVTTVAGNGTMGFSGDGGPATRASLDRPLGVAVDDAGNFFFADQLNHRIRRVDAVTGIITTVAGNGTPGYGGDGGPATSASLREPPGVAVDPAGNLFIADPVNHRIRRVDATTGIITTVAGNGISGFSGDGGPATSANLGIGGVAVDKAGNLFIITSNAIRRVDAATGIITTVAGIGISGFSGDGGPATSARLNDPRGIAVDDAGNLFIADMRNHRIRRVDAK
jgi:sugar lactone lactonase YvrE